jgi:hypothetical protein
LIAFIELFRDIFHRKQKSYRTTGFVFRHPVIVGRMFSSVRVSQRKAIEGELFFSLDTILALKTAKYARRPIHYLIILKEISTLLSTAANFLRFLKVRKSPNVFSCIRNKLMPKNDGKNDPAVYEGNCYNFRYLNCRNHFYGESKNFIGIRREKFEAGYLGI